MIPNSFQTRLLQWYRRHKRDLPWRRTRDPYAILVSEIMLQQTTVEAVIPYYERFLKRFPDVKTLAQASEDDVLRLWSGLGYYSRARNLLGAAKIICSNGLAIPDTAEALQKLPGIGRYTAGAIASIAFDAKAPIVDGNVIRVLSRLFTIGKDPKSSDGQKIFWKKAGDILPGRDCGDFNQALMELGATVCLPELPRCDACPLRLQCRASNTGTVLRYPKRPIRKAAKEVTLSAAVIQEGEKILFVRRPQTGILKGLWEIPMVEGDLVSLAAAFPIEVGKKLSSVRHSVLNRRLKILPVLARLKKPLAASLHSLWVCREEVDRLPTSSMNKKILRSL